jgi:hypothetical protein
MKDRIEGVSGIGPERRVQARRETDRGGGAPESFIQPEPEEAQPPTLPAVVEAPAPAPEPDARPRSGGAAAYVAQVLGQPGEKRGLRGGPETLEKARTSYLETEYSGTADRRPPPGKVTRTDV